MNGLDCFSKWEILKRVMPEQNLDITLSEKYSAAIVIVNGFKDLRITKNCTTTTDLGIKKLRDNKICYLDIKIGEHVDREQLMSILSQANINDKFFLHISNTVHCNFIDEHVFEVDYLFDVIDFFYERTSELHIEIADKIIYDSIILEGENTHPLLKRISKVTIKTHNELVDKFFTKIKEYAFKEKIFSFRVAKELYTYSNVKESMSVTTVYRRLDTDYLERIS